MSYRILKYKKKRKFVKCPFETYEPEKRIKINKGQAVPLLIRIGNIGGLIGFWASSFLMVIKSFFATKEKIKQTARKFSFNNRVVEIRIKDK